MLSINIHVRISNISTSHVYLVLMHHLITQERITISLLSSSKKSTTKLRRPAQPSRQQKPAKKGPSKLKKASSTHSEIYNRSITHLRVARVRPDKEIHKIRTLFARAHAAPEFILTVLRSGNFEPPSLSEN